MVEPSSSEADAAERAEARRHLVARAVCGDCGGEGRISGLDTYRRRSFRVECERCDGTGESACPRCSERSERDEGADQCVACDAYDVSEEGMQ